MKRAACVALGLGLACVTDAQAETFDPQRYMPADAGFVAAWKKPAETLTKLETLATRAGLAPPGTQTGWLREALVRQTPELSNVDLNRPIWVASMPETSKTDPPPVVVVLGVEGKAERLSARMGPKMTIVRKGEWVVAHDNRLPKSYGRPRSKPFRFPPHSQPLHARSEIGSYLRLSAYPALRAALEADEEADLEAVPAGMRPLLSALSSLSQQPWEDTEGLGFGMGLPSSGLEVLVQNHPKVGSELQASMKEVANVPAALVRGLPALDYLMVVGMAESPRAKSGREAFWAKALEGLADADPDTKEKLKDLRAITRRHQPCRNHSLGLSVGGAVESLRMVSTSKCESSARFMATLRSVLKWTSEVLVDASPPDADRREGAAVQAKLEKKAMQVAGVALDEWSVDWPDEAASPDTAAAVGLLERPLRFGAVNGASTVLLWNVPEPVARQAVEASRRDQIYSGPASLAAARRGLLSPRYAESYLFAGPLVSLAGASAMGDVTAVFRVLLARMPPVALAAQAQPDGSQLYQLVLPEQLAQLAAAIAQSRASNGP